VIEKLKKIIKNIEYFNHRHLLKNNEKLKNKHLGKKAFLFGTGTSLLDVDLTKFNGEITIACNDIYKHPSFSSLDLKYYTVAMAYRHFHDSNNPRFTREDHHKYFLQIDKEFRYRNTVHFFHATIQKYIKKRILLSSKKCYYYDRKGPMLEKKELTVDLSKPDSFFDGGLENMIALAIFMGCKEIYLFGCGYTYQPVQIFHFYDCFTYQKGLTKKGVASKFEFFKKFHNWHSERNEESWKKSITAEIELNNKSMLLDFMSYQIDKEGSNDDFYWKHRLIKKIADFNDARILNVVPNGYESPVYEKVPIEDI